MKRKGDTSNAIQQPLSGLVCNTQNRMQIAHRTFAVDNSGWSSLGISRRAQHDKANRHDPSPRNQGATARRVLFSIVIEIKKGRGGRVVDGTGLENRHTRKGIGGSNPSLSAITFSKLRRFGAPL